MNKLFTNFEEPFEPFQTVDLHCPKCGRKVRFAIPNQLEDKQLEIDYWKGEVERARLHITSLQIALGLIKHP